jgi:hypothetical protein
MHNPPKPTMDFTQTWVLPADELAARRGVKRACEATPEVTPVQGQGKGLSAAQVERLLEAAAARESSPSKRR